MHALQQMKQSTGPPDAATAMATLAVKGNKESRASEALAMKDEQMRILGDQNSHLLLSLNAMDDEIHALKQHKLALEDENRSLRDANFELQSKARAAETNLTKSQAGMEERDTQIKVLTDHNTELLRLLEHEEAQSSSLAAHVLTLKADLDALQTKYTSLLATAKTHEEIAARATRDGQLRAEEVRLLRNESDQLRACNTELKMKTQVELEALQEQLRVRKEKQYQLLAKLQQLEEVKRQSDDHVSSLEDALRRGHERTQELETQLQLESKAKRAQVDANKSFFIENGNLLKDKQELQVRVDRAEHERTRMEAENRDSAEQLREMAEKVFQLLERLKLAELGKTKAIDGLKQKELELLALKKKNARLLKEGTQEGKARVKSELDKKVLLEQLQALKKHNAQLSLRCSDEVKAKLQESEARKVLDEKIKTMSSRVAFLLNKMQADEEAKLVSKEETKKLVAQVTSLQDKAADATQKLFATAESNRVVTEALRCKQDELDAQRIKMDALEKKLGELAVALETSGVAGSGGRDLDNNNQEGHGTFARDGMAEAPHPDDAAVDALNGRFFVESRASHGGLLVIKAKRQPGNPAAQQQAVAFLDKVRINAFLKRAQKNLNTKQMLVERIASLLAAILSADDTVDASRAVVQAKSDQIAHLARKAKLLQEKLTTEEDAKRKTLLRYVHEIKSRAALVQQPHYTGTSASASDDSGVLKLPESGVGDEEVHAIAALLRNAPNVKELQLRGNAITSEGARAIAAVLGTASCQLRLVDLRGNAISKDGVKVLAEALERNERTKHVYVHAGGKIEALGTTSAAATTSMLNAQAMSSAVGSPSSSLSSGLIGVETICVVDVREQLASRPELRLFDDDDDADVDATSGAQPQLQTAATALGSSSGPGSAFKLKMASVGAATGANDSLSKDASSNSSARLFSRRPLSAAALKKHKEKLQQQRKKRAEDAKRLAKQEAEWNGRAGGLDASSSSSTALATPQSKKLPPITTNASSSSTNSSSSSDVHSPLKGVSRTNSAPVLKKKATDDPIHHHH